MVSFAPRLNSGAHEPPAEAGTRTRLQSHSSNQEWQVFKMEESNSDATSKSWAKEHEKDVWNSQIQVPDTFFVFLTDWRRRRSWSPIGRRSTRTQTHVRSASTTSPATSVSRKSRPWKRKVSFVWSRPSKWRRVA